MQARAFRFTAIIVALVIGLLALILALPVPAWRTGRLDVQPLNLVAGGPKAALGSRIWIDTDAACGASPMTDPDDCLAIAWLGQQREFDIVGISTSFGNADGDVVQSTVGELVETMRSAGRPAPPLWYGASGPLHATAPETWPARDALRAALEQGPLTIIALGPLTNIAAALSGRADLQRRVVSLVAVMGRRPGHIFHPSEGSGRGVLFGHGPIFRDLNFTKDPGAVRSILEMRLPITLVP